MVLREVGRTCGDSIGPSSPGITDVLHTGAGMCPRGASSKLPWEGKHFKLFSRGFQ